MTQRFVLLPPEGELNRGANHSGRLLMARLKLREGENASVGGMAMLGGVVPPEATFASSAASSLLSTEELVSAETNGQPLPPVRVVKRIPDDDGAMLIALNDDDRLALQTAYPGARMVPEGRVNMAHLAYHIQELAFMSLSTVTAANTLTIKVRDSSGKPIARTPVQCIFSATTTPPTGATSLSDAHGKVSFLVPKRFKHVIVAVHPTHSAWPAQTALIAMTAKKKSATLVCPTITNTQDCAQTLYNTTANTDGTDVVVAVIDGGAGPHRLLRIAGGENVVEDESPNNVSDNGVGHGTHVAGLIAARATAKLRGGFAPSVKLLVFRVFAEDALSTGSFAVAEAIRKAVDAGADFINLSLVLPSDQPEVTRELRRARALGVVVVAAAGNSSNAVQFPARFTDVIAVSAMGIVGCAPAGSSIDTLLLGMPTGANVAHRFANFSCAGPEIDLVGPGVGIVSLAPRNRRAVMSGTSMAAPVVTARAARALSSVPALLGAMRDQARSNAITQLVIGAARPLGFGARFEGHGIAP